MKLQIKRLSATAVLPRYMTDGAAGMDLATCFAFRMFPGERRLIPLGFAIEIQPGFEAQVRSRSGASLNKGLAVLNSPGTIDSDYRGEVCVLLVNHSEDPQRVEPGDRIAQLVLAPVVRAELVEVEALDETARGAGGFGSTGK